MVHIFYTEFIVIILILFIVMKASDGYKLLLFLLLFLVRVTRLYDLSTKTKTTQNRRFETKKKCVVALWCSSTLMRFAMCALGKCLYSWPPFFIIRLILIYGPMNQKVIYSSFCTETKISSSIFCINVCCSAFKLNVL